MSGDFEPDPTAPPLAALAESIVAVFLEPQNLEKLRKHEQSVRLESAKDGAELVKASARDISEWIAEILIEATSAPGPIGDGLARAAMNTLLTDGGPREQAGIAIGRRLIAKLSAASGQAQPGYDGAAGFLGLILSEQVEAWMRGVLVETLTSVKVGPFSLTDSVETFARLQDIVESMLGGGRLVRQVLGPIIRATAVTPAEWATNKQYSPELLSAAAAIEAHLSGQFTNEQLIEELARQGYSLERINVLVNNARRRLSFADLTDQHFRGAISDVDVIARAGELGYDQATARELLELATARRRDRLKDPIVDAAIAAFVAGDIGEGEFRSLVEANAPTLSDAPLIIDAARVRKGLRRRTLAPAEERRLVLKRLRAVSDYRRALEREDYEPDAVTALELELRMELDNLDDVAEARAAAAAERDAERAAAAEARAARDAELAARKALPTLQEYRRAYVHGTIDRGAFSAAIAREKVAIAPADLELIVGEADLDRGAWLEKQERAEQAREQSPGAELSVARLEAAVLAGVLTLAEFDARLAGAGYADDDRRILDELLAGRLEDQADAQERRARAAAAAEVKGISLPQLERAVRLGVRTRADYAATLEQLGTPEISRALLLDLLDAAIARDEAAREARGQRDPVAAAAGLSLAQRRRAVVAGVLPRADYEAALIAARWPVDDQLVELSLLDLEAAAAADARARRDHVAGELGGELLTLNQVERAVRLGLLPATALRAWLEDRGYGAGDVETIVALAVAAVPDVRAGQVLEQRVAGELARKGLSLAQLQAATRRGLRTLDQYAEALRESGYGEDDAALLRQLLEEQLAVDVVGLRAKIGKALEARDDAPPLEQLEAALHAGELEIGEWREILEAFGVARDAAIVFGRVLLSFGMEG